ncbi:hypothetical protein FJT64_022809 [Amphibalanus amphitrite]|uniref:C-type lectin domain-containing protein n=1 Tax=Amphibalanus amphitrite TaxID=1232801 RepID=A0A6A4WP98_AMPAM|nr:hypothetical protein FJT64_022809 [Amphibalanus amphitrite]
MVEELSQGLSTWLGLYRSDSYGTWRWRSSSSSLSYTHWAEGQPNNTHSCAVQLKNGYWETASCNTTSVKHHVICYVNSGY